MQTIVIDDDQHNRRRVQEMLERAGHRTRGFETADDARAALIDHEADCGLVVTDVNMPGDNDGIDLALALRDLRPSLPVIVMSASANELDRARAVGLTGPTLLKPILDSDLRGAVRETTADRPVVRFADPARAVALMFHEAQAAGDPHVGSEHLALAALAGPQGLGDLAARARVDPTTLRQALLTCCSHPKVRGEAGATFRVTRMIAVASHIASTEGLPEVEPRHLVRALLTAPRAVAWAGLSTAGLDQSTVSRLLDEPPPGARPISPIVPRRWHARVRSYGRHHRECHPSRADEGLGPMTPQRPTGPLGRHGAPAEDDG